MQENVVPAAQSKECKHVSYKDENKFDNQSHLVVLNGNVLDGHLLELV